jgi:putative membrane protein
MPDNSGHMSTRREKVVLIVLYFIVAALLGIRPEDRQVWAIENSVPFIEGLALIVYWHWKKVELTRLSYFLVFSHLVIQMIGGHYTYAKVPLFDYLKEVFDWSRNHYDRVAHFAVGFCLYNPVREICLRRTPLGRSRAWAAFFALTVIAAVGGIWEVWEWLVAIAAPQDSGMAYLGEQGDRWDAQKDIALAPLGAIAAIFLFTKAHDKQLELAPGFEQNEIS